MNHTKHEIVLSKATVRLIAPHIIENIIHDFSELEVCDLKAIHEANLILAGDKPYVILGDPGSMTSSTDDARSYFANLGKDGQNLAKALLINSLGHLLVAKMFISVKKPIAKTKIFRNREDAIRWLEEITVSVNQNRNLY